MKIRQKKKMENFVEYDKWKFYFNLNEHEFKLGL